VVQNTGGQIIVGAWTRAQGIPMDRRSCPLLLHSSIPSVVTNTLEMVKCEIPVLILVFKLFQIRFKFSFALYGIRYFKYQIRNTLQNYIPA